MYEMSRRILKAEKAGKIHLPEEKFVKLGKIHGIFGEVIGKSTIYWLVANKKVESFKIDGDGIIMVNVQDVYDYFVKRA